MRVVPVVDRTCMAAVGMRAIHMRTIHVGACGMGTRQVGIGCRSLTMRAAAHPVGAFRVGTRQMAVV